MSPDTAWHPIKGVGRGKKIHVFQSHRPQFCSNSKRDWLAQGPGNFRLQSPPVPPLPSWTLDPCYCENVLLLNYLYRNKGRGLSWHWLGGAGQQWKYILYSQGVIFLSHMISSFYSPSSFSPSFPFYLTFINSSTLLHPLKVSISISRNKLRVSWFSWNFMPVSSIRSPSFHV